MIDLELFHAAQGYLRGLSQNQMKGADSLAAWERFYGICDQLIRRFATAFGARAADVEDCSQETWTELVQLLMKFDYDPQRGDFRTWLYKIVRSATVNFLRRRNHQKDLCRKLSQLGGEQPESAPERSSAPDLSMETLLDHARECLTPTNYRLMCLRWIEGQDVDAVARKLGFSHEQVWYHEHRIRKSLKRVLAQTSTETAPLHPRETSAFQHTPPRSRKRGTSRVARTRRQTSPHGRHINTSRSGSTGFDGAQSRIELAEVRKEAIQHLPCL